MQLDNCKSDKIISHLIEVVQKQYMYFFKMAYTSPLLDLPIFKILDCRIVPVCPFKTRQCQDSPRVKVKWEIISIQASNDSTSTPYMV